MKRYKVTLEDEDYQAKITFHVVEEVKEEKCKHEDFIVNNGRRKYCCDCGKRIEEVGEHKELKYCECSK